MSRIALALLAGLQLSLFAAACSDPGSAARPTAEAFLDAHYVDIDLERAKGLVDGLARDKIDKEIQLTEGQEISGETLRPHVGYKLQRADEKGELAVYAYELTIRAPGSDPFRKLVTLTVRDTKDVWAVTNYAESDLPDAR